jgi:hypothetical protein
MARGGEREIDDFIAELATRYEAYTRNRVREDKTGEEIIVPVTENKKVHEELQRKIDELCALYLTLSDEERDYIRNLVQPHRPLHNGLLRHIGWTARYKPPDWLRRGLAAASIEDNREDFRDTFVALGGLYLEAARTGIDASDCIQEAARFSSPIPGPHFPTSMRDFFSNFERSEFFKQSIQSKLPRK